MRGFGIQQKSAQPRYISSGTGKNPSPLNRVTQGEGFNVGETICSRRSDPFKIRLFQRKLIGLINFKQEPAGFAERRFLKRKFKEGGKTMYKIT